jgi:hypothetical protein
MPASDSERLKRLRQTQLVDRDPLVKQRKFQHDSVVKEKRMQKPFSLKRHGAIFRTTSEPRSLD